MNKEKFDIIMLLDHPIIFGNDPRVFRTLHELQKNNISTCLICIANDNFPAFEIIQNIPVYRLIPVTASRVTSLIHFRTKIAKEISEKFKFKGIFCNDEYMLDMGTRVKKLNKNSFLIYDAHEYKADYHYDSSLSQSFIYKTKTTLFRRIYAMLEKKNLEKVDVFLTISQSFLQLFKDINTLNCTSFVVRNIATFKELKENETHPDIPYSQLESISNQKNIIYIGDYYIKENGIETVFNALTKLPHDVSLILVGLDRSKGYFTQLIEELHLTHRILVIPKIPQKFLKQIAEYASVSVIPTMSSIHKQVYYSLPNKLFDSIKLGLPIICTELPEHKRIIDEFNNGIHTNAENSNQATTEIIAAYNTIIQNLDSFNKNTEIAAKKLNTQLEYAPVILEIKKQLSNEQA